MPNHSLLSKNSETRTFRSFDHAKAAAPWVAALVVVCLAITSLFIGALDVSISGLLTGDDGQMKTFLISRVPRTGALILTGSSMACAGVVMQHLARNKFVAPTTAGTVDAASLGLLAATIVIPQAPILAKVGIATAFAGVGTAIFMMIVSRLKMTDALFVPLIGIVLAGVFRSIAEFIAVRNNLEQSLQIWLLADFSGIISGRWETLWIGGAAAVLAYVLADRLTVTGMGRDLATSVGINYQAVLTVGLGIVSLATAIVVTTVGAVPFLGLIVPNLVTMVLGDNLRRNLPTCAMVGAILVLACDIVGRLIIAPYELSVGVIVGVIGAVIFLTLTRRGGRYAMD